VVLLILVNTCCVMAAVVVVPSLRWVMAELEECHPTKIFHHRLRANDVSFATAVVVW
jgi:hypothetical protein